MVTIEPPDFGPGPNPAVERIEHYLIRDDSGRIAFHDTEEPLAWIESDVFFPAAAVDGYTDFADLSGVESCASRQKQKRTDR